MIISIFASNHKNKCLSLMGLSRTDLVQDANVSSLWSMKDNGKGLLFLLVQNKRFTLSFSAPKQKVVMMTAFHYSTSMNCLPCRAINVKSEFIRGETSSKDMDKSRESPNTALVLYGLKTFHEVTNTFQWCGICFDFCIEDLFSSLIKCH